MLPSTWPFVSSKYLLSRAQTLLFHSLGDLLGYKYKGSSRATRLRLDAGESDVPTRYRDSDHTKGQDDENEVAIKRERPAAVNRPSEDRGKGGWTGCCRQRDQHHREAVERATLGRVYRVIDCQRCIDEHLLLEGIDKCAARDPGQRRGRTHVKSAAYVIHCSRHMCCDVEPSGSGPEVGYVMSTSKWYY